MTRNYLALVAVASLCRLAYAQQPTLYAGPNVNMVSGTVWPTGDPFLQRQNEPSMAISSRNPLHLLAGANDYRSVDIKFPPSASDAPEPTGDAWLGLFKSFDGGRTWISNLVPGYPQDQSPEGLASPLKHQGLPAGADPGVRAGTNGMFYYSGLAFSRAANGASAIFVARFIDDNNVEGADTIRYLDTHVVAYSNPPARTQTPPNATTYFEDKPAIAVDLPRPGANTCTVPGPSTAGGASSPEAFKTGNIYVAWTQLNLPESNDVASIQFSRSRDCGVTWSTPITLSTSTVTNQGANIQVDPNTGAIYVVWRAFHESGAATTEPDQIMFVASDNAGETFSNPIVVARINSFDQRTNPQGGSPGPAFRTNDFPVMAVDYNSKIYIAWSQRSSPTGTCPSSTAGSPAPARIIFVTGSVYGWYSFNSVNVRWTNPMPVDTYTGSGHQFMPALAFSAGKLTAAWYDQRYSDQVLQYAPLGGGQYHSTFVSNGGAPLYPQFGECITDPSPEDISKANGLARRQTIDVFAAQLIPSLSQSFGPAVLVSQYEFGSFSEAAPIEQVQVNPPNLPMFQSGTAPFIGDYFDVAGPTFLAEHDGTWRYNNFPGDPDFTRVVWTDNRNVVQPADNDWSDYVPPTYSTSSKSTFDPTQPRQPCTPSFAGQTGDRNQDIFTARLSSGLTVSARTNFKQLGFEPGTSTLVYRQFPITVQNDSPTASSYQLAIVSQPPGGSASFVQYAPVPVTSIIISVGAHSSEAQSVFVKSSDPHAKIEVTVVQVNSNGVVIPGGQQGSATINADISNPNISNPNISNPNISNVEVYNPNISNPNISNPNTLNPNISNPNISNPNISNTTVANPNISNPNISNPNISNPNISNPNISNPNISNPNISNDDVSDGVISDATWTLTNTGNTASTYKLQVNDQTPAKIFSQLIVSQYYTTPVALGCKLSVQSHYLPVSNTISPKSATPTIALQPGESALVTYRVFDTLTKDPATALKQYNPLVVGHLHATPQGANTNSPSRTPQPVTAPADVTSSVAVTTTAFPQNFVTKLYTGEITVRNTSAAALKGPLFVLLNQLPTNITAANALGTSPGGPFYLLLNSPLAPGQRQAVSVEFSDMPNAPITFTTKVFSGGAP
ncbi:MAG: hypothetical protein JOY54_13830 [Acidobacteriaceae bacterium]|nr:hypothetical protein [Acidobacteriaceae bacterium]